MRINWNDPSQNSQADLDALAHWIRDTDPKADHSDLYHLPKRNDTQRTGSQHTAA